MGVERFTGGDPNGSSQPLRSGALGRTLHVLVPALETIALDSLGAAVADSRYNQPVCRVKDSVVRLGVMAPERAGVCMVETAPVFDSHLHVIDPRFPLVPNRGYVPEPFTAAEYRAHALPLGVVGGAVVSGSFQAFDQGYLLDALRELGPGFAGVTQLPPSVTDAEIEELDRAGVRAVRFNLVRGGFLGPADLDALARRVRALVEGAGQRFDYQSFPQMGHSMHEQDPALYAATLRAWTRTLPDHVEP